MNETVEQDQLDSLMGRVADEYLERLNRGEHPQVEEYASRYPELAVVIRQTLPAVECLRGECSTEDPIGNLPPVEPPISGCLGDYRLLRLIGRGGMGVVYEAEQISLNRRVALKVLPFAATLDPKQLQRFKTEAQAAGQLEHPHIVPVYAVGLERGVHYYAMRYIDGRSVASLIEELRSRKGSDGLKEMTTGETNTPGVAGLITAHTTHGDVYFRAIAQLGVQAAEALEHAHQLGVLHRDIKPANLLLDTHGSLWITDFGLARIASDAPLTMSGDLVGTLRYMSPEQALARPGLVDGRTDVYSLGVTLYELVTLEPAFPGRNRETLLRQVTFEEPLAPRHRNPATPRELETILLKAIAKHPTERYPSAQELADDLRRFVEDRPIRARRTSVAGRARRWCRHNPALAVVSGAALTLLAASLIGGAFGVERNSHARSLGRQQELTVEALAKAEAYRDRAQRVSASLSQERGLSWCDQGDAPRGLLWLAEALKLAPEGAADLQQDIRRELDRWQRDSHSLRCYLPHKDSVKAVALSSDGKLLATASDDRTARIWELGSGSLVGPPLQHDGAVGSVVFSLDSKTILTASADKTARLWRVPSGQLLATLHHQDEVALAVFSPDSKSILTASLDQTARLWDAESGKEVRRFAGYQGVVTAACFSPDGKTVALGDFLGTAGVWDVASARMLGFAMKHLRRVSSIGWTPDGFRIITASRDGTARIWNAATGQALSQPLQHGHAIGELALSADGKIFATADTDGTARVWDARSGSPIGRPLQHVAAIYALAISPDSRFVATGSWDGTVRMWESATGLPVDAPFPHPKCVQALTFCADGLELVTGSDDGARIWRLHASLGMRGRGEYAEAEARRLSLDLFLPHGEPIGEVAASPDGKTLVTLNRDADSGEARLWDMNDFRLRKALPRRGKPRSAAISADSNLLAVAFQNGPTILWEVATGKEIGKLPLEGGAISVAFSSDGKIAVSCDDRIIRFWDIATLKETGTPIRNRYLKSGLTFTPDGKLLFLVEDSAGMVYDPATGKVAGGPLMNEGSWVYAGAFSPDGKTLITGGGNGTVQLWDMATLAGFKHAYEDVDKNRPRATLVHTPQAPVAAVAYSPDGKTILSGCHDGTARLWDAEACRAIGTPFREKDRVHAVAFVSGGKRMATTCRDGSMRIRKMPTPLVGSAERILLWCQVRSNLRLNEDGRPEALDGAAWQQRRQVLDELGGPPAP